LRFHRRFLLFIEIGIGDGLGKRFGDWMFLHFGADGGVALLVRGESAGEVLRTAGQSGHGFHEFREEFGLLIQQAKDVAMVVLGHDLAELFCGEGEGVLLDAVSVEGADTMFEGFDKGRAGFELMLPSKPIHIAVIFPEGDIVLGDSWVAEIVQVRSDVAVTEAAAEHGIDGLAEIVGEPGDLADARAGG